MSETLDRFIAGLSFEPDDYLRMPSPSHDNEPVTLTVASHESG
jgi:hypothetical protein